MTRAHSIAASCLAAVWAGEVGCARLRRPDLGPDRTVERGVAVPFGVVGGMVWEWDFGDGARATGDRVSHVYDASGAFVVRALKGGQERGAAHLEVTPRLVTRAIPDTADGAFYLPRIQGRLDACVDWAERLLGPDSVQRFLEAASLPQLALESAAVEKSEGMGLFTLPGFEGLIGLVAARDGQRLLEDLAQRLSAAGGAPEQEPDGSIRIASPSGGETLTLMVDRGYLFAVMPQRGSRANGAAALAAIRGSAASGLAGQPRFGGPMAGVAPGVAQVYLQITSQRDDKARAVVATLQLGERTGTLDGWVDAQGPLWSASGAPASHLLDRAPPAPIFSLLAQVNPHQLDPLVTALGWEALRRRGVAGMTRRDLEGALEALAGDVGALGYFDADAFYRHLAEAGAQPEPKGALLFKAGVVRPELLRPWIGRLLDGFPSVQATWTPGAVTLESGAPSGPARVDVGAALRQRVGSGPFEPGHLLAVLDLSELLRQLEVPRQVRGVSASRLAILQGFSAAFLRQLTPVDFAFVDLAPDPRGARFHASVTLRP